MQIRKCRHNTQSNNAGCLWEMEREAFLHPISRLPMWPEVGGPGWLRAVLKESFSPVAEDILPVAEIRALL
ncbi:hypothetical protein TNCV_4328951 [Trichonephila clavipes]|nr:hypothetical protein TNCV_4328951 [Trichonephila clavipes]